MPNIKIASLQGQDFGAYCAMPSGGHGPGLVVIQEIFGVNAYMRKLCDAYAAKGYIAVCSDLFWRLDPGVQLDPNIETERNRGFELFKQFDAEAAVRDLLSTLAHIRKMAGCSGKVGAVGYCLGGKLAYLMATRSDVDAAVGYYGVELDKYLDEIHDIRMPLMLHIAALDKFVPPDVRAQILKATARNPVITTHVYQGADHAFARIGGDHFDATAADLANQRTDEFFARYLQG